MSTEAISRNVAKIIPMIPHIIKADEKLLDQVFNKATGASPEEGDAIKNALIQANYDPDKFKFIMQIINPVMTPDEIAQDLNASVKDILTTIDQIESDAKMAKEMQEEDESKSGGDGAATPGPVTTDRQQSTLTSAWGKSSSGMSASETKIMFDHMAMSAKANQATRNSKKTPAKTLEDELKAVTSKIFALCEENKIAGFNKERQSRINKHKEEQEKLNKQIAATRPTCQTCDSCVYIHDGVPKPLCSACYTASRQTCTRDGCNAKVSMNPYTHKYNPLCTTCHKESILPSSVVRKGSSYGKKGNATRQMTPTDYKKH